MSKSMYPIAIKLFISNRHILVVVFAWSSLTGNAKIEMGRNVTIKQSLGVHVPVCATTTDSDRCTSKPANGFSLPPVEQVNNGSKTIKILFIARWPSGMPCQSIYHWLDSIHQWPHNWREKAKGKKRVEVNTSQCSSSSQSDTKANEHRCTLSILDKCLAIQAGKVQ